MSSYGRGCLCEKRRLCPKLGELDAGHRIGPLTSSDRSAN